MAEDPDRILADWYIAQVSSHVEAMVGIFFGLFSSLVLIYETRCFFLSSFLFSIIYTILVGSGFYFYTRLVYFNQMAEDCLIHLQALECRHVQRRNVVISRLRTRARFWRLLIRADHGGLLINEDQQGGYNIRSTWLGAIFYIAINVTGLIALCIAVGVWIYLIELVIATIIGLIVVRN